MGAALPYERCAGPAPPPDINVGWDSPAATSVEINREGTRDTGSTGVGACGFVDVSQGNGKGGSVGLDLCRGSQLQHSVASGICGSPQFEH
jgi:hypothetical protein